MAAACDSREESCDLALRQRVCLVLLYLLTYTSALWTQKILCRSLKNIYIL